MAAVSAQLVEAGYDAIAVNTAEELAILLVERHDIGVAILDGENDFDRTIEMYALLHDEGGNIPALMVVAARALDRMGLANLDELPPIEEFMPPVETANELADEMNFDADDTETVS